MRAICQYVAVSKALPYHQSLEPHVEILFSVIHPHVRHCVIGAMRDTWSGWTWVPERPWGESEVVGYSTLPISLK